MWLDSSSWSGSVPYGSLVYSHYETHCQCSVDGFAVLAACMLTVGMVMFMRRRKPALGIILIGRAVDMLRAMRFFQIIRDIVRRSSGSLSGSVWTGPFGCDKNAHFRVCWYGLFVVERLMLAPMENDHSAL